MSGTESWPTDPVALIEFLRRSNFTVGTGEALRAIGLLDRLRVMGRAPRTPDEAARWLAPVLCSSAREQAALPLRFLEFDRLADEDGAKPPAVTTQPSRLVRAARHPAVLAAATVCLLAALVPLLRWLTHFLGGDPAPGADAALVPSAPVEASALGGGGAGWWSRFGSVPPAVLLPPLGALTYWLWRLGEVPVMGRRPYTSAAITLLQTAIAKTSLFAAGDVADAVRGLRAHRQVPAGVIDVRASVRATVAAAGRPILISGRKAKTPDYPVLVETVSARDHTAAMARLVSARLAEESVFHKLYMFGADPELLRDEHDAPFSLNELATHYGSEVLIFVGDGSVFVDAIFGGMRHWTEALTGWRIVVLLTPVPRRRWSSRERCITDTGIILLPLTSAGLSEFGTFLNGALLPPRLGMERPPVRAGPLVREGLHSSRWHTSAVPDEDERETVLDAIRQDLPVNAFELLAVTALFPECRPDLTLHLGAELHDRQGHKLLDEEGFGAVAALPWMRYGRMPDWLRLDLVQTLDGKQEAKAREVLSGWINARQPDAGLAGQTLAIETGRGRAVAAGAPAPAGGIIRDAIFLHLIRGEFLVSRLELRAPADLEKRLQRPWYGRPRTVWVAAAAISFVFAAAALWFPDAWYVFAKELRRAPFRTGQVQIALLAASLAAGLFGLWTSSPAARRRCGVVAVAIAGMTVPYLGERWGLDLGLSMLASNVAAITLCAGLGLALVKQYRSFSADTLLLQPAGREFSRIARLVQDASPAGLATLSWLWSRGPPIETDSRLLRFFEIYGFVVLLSGILLLAAAVLVGGRVGSVDLKLLPAIMYSSPWPLMNVLPSTEAWRLAGLGILNLIFGGWLIADPPKGGSFRRVLLPGLWLVSLAPVAVWIATLFVL